MKKRFQLLCAVAAALFVLFGAADVFAAGEQKASPSVSGALHVDGTKLTGEDGNPVQLRGISTHGIAWFPDYINEPCFQQLKEEWGANIVRLAMYTSENLGYCNGGDQEYLKGLIEKGVSCATAQDMYVIIDWHILSDSNPQIHKDEAKAFFEEMSAKYADANNVLYEICNEPNGATSWAEVKAYAEEVIGVIRAHDEDAVIIVGTPNWCQYVDQAAADPITEYDNIMYALHFYAATHKEDLRSRMVSAIEAGLPVFVSEYGICDASGNGDLDIAQADAWVDLLDQYNVSYLLWSLCNKDESASVLKSSCNKTSGFTVDDLSPCGRWLYQTLSGETLPEQADEATEAGGSEESSTQQETEGKSVTVTSGDMQIEAQQTGSWESEGKTYAQYNLAITNKGADCTYWAVDLAFSEPVQLSDGWNGDYSVKENTLHITNKGYNGTIESGKTLEDVGFIVIGGGAIKEQ